jgi:thiamine biosynthesis lipoprotein
MLYRREFIRFTAASILSLAGVTAVGGCARTGTSSEGDSQATKTNTTSAAINQSGSPAEVTLTDFLFDTVITISASCEQNLLDKAHERLVYFEDIFSRTKEGSDIFLLNTAGGKPVEVHPETADIVRFALPFCEASKGLFDITIGAVTSLWDFDEGRVPSPQELEQAVPHIDYRTVAVEGTTITLADPQAMLDLGAVAKGYIADDIASLLREGGCVRANINLGGNVFVLGSKSGGEPWNVGIQDPLQPRGTICGYVSVTDTSVVTSGPYERSFEQDGVLYHHILDPRTGYPVQTDLASTTIISESSAEGDALTTTTFLLGKEAALKLIDAKPHVQALFIGNEGDLLCSQNANFNALEG